MEIIFDFVLANEDRGAPPFPQADEDILTDLVAAGNEFDVTLFYGEKKAEESAIGWSTTGQSSFLMILAQPEHP